MKKAIHELPTDLEMLYKSFLESKRGSEPLCDPRPIIAVCAAPKPMTEEALRQLLALNMTTGSYTSDDILSTDALIQSGVGLIALDSTEKLILIVHDTVRTFIFSDAAVSATNQLLHADPRAHILSPFQATTIPTTRRETEARVSLGRACLVHLHFHLETSRSLDPGPVQIQRSLPTMRVSVPSWLQRPVQKMLPHALGKSAVMVHLPYRERNEPPQRDGFFQYARENWLACNLGLREGKDVQGQSQERLFQSIAMERAESWDIHPWQALIRSASQQLAEMFAYSIANGHLPLLELALQHKDSLPKDIFTGLLPNHGHLPALHMACKLGHDFLLEGLSRVCDLSTRCRMSKTAIHYAAEYGHMNCIDKIATYFRGSGCTCTLNDIIDHQDSRCRTALHLAITNGHKDVALRLTRIYKAKKAVGDRSGLTAAELACDMGYDLGDLNPGEGDLESRLLVAVMEGKAHRVQMLCKAYRYLNMPDSSGSTVLVHACRKGHKSVVKILLESDFFDLDQERTIEVGHRRLALTVAAAAGHADVVRVLLEPSFAIIGPVIGGAFRQTWHSVEAAVLGHYYGTSRSLDAARAIVGEMATSLTDLSKNLDTFLRAAAEIGQADVVRHLRLLRLRHMHPRHALIETERTDMLRYLDRRSTGIEALEKLEIYVEIPLVPQMDLVGY